MELDPVLAKFDEIERQLRELRQLVQDYPRTTTTPPPLEGGEDPAEA